MKSCFAYLTDVSDAQAKRQTDQGLTYQLVIRAREIFCIPKTHVIEGEFIIGSVNEYQCTFGLTEPQWHEIEKKIAQALK